MAEDKGNPPAGGEIAKREEEILAFWQKNRIFEKSEAKKAPKGEFVFYDGPPFATGLPHSGSLLSSIIKDVIPRYKTMRGYSVRRRWGWDCHGLPIENMVEKELGLRTKKDIETMGVEKFNKACRDAVLRCEGAWKEYVDRIGRFVHFEDSYKTMDNTYIESVWWGLKEIYDKKLLYEGRKVLLYCPHCETPLAKAEIAQDNSYKDVTEEAVTVAFQVKSKPQTFLLAWTTTPWTLPGNVALAVHPDIDYVTIEKKDEGVKDKVRFILAKEQLEAIVGTDEYEIIEEMKGKNLVGLEYEPLFEIEAIKDSGKKAHYVSEGDFVTTEEGTGIVHTAVMYGEDDYELGLKLDLPQVQLLSQNGHFNDLAPELVRGEYFKKAEKTIKEDLESRRLLFDRKNYTHSYPYCHRCGTALLYNAISSWFINIQDIKKKLIKNNEKINWFPEHLKHGRFLHTLESAPDWTISRNRYWASPMPIWKDSKGDITFIGSLEELKKKTKTSGNAYHIIRHGESVLNTKHILNADMSTKNPLTDKGRGDVLKAAKNLRDKEINLIFHSPLERTRETATLLKEELGLTDNQVVEDKRLQEITFGEFEGKTVENYHSFFEYSHERLTKPPKGGETWTEVKKRASAFLHELEEKYNDKDVLIVSHNGVLQMLQAGAHGLDVDACAHHIAEDSYDIKNAEIRKLEFVPLPHNENYELDLHRPYIDEITLVNGHDEELVRVSEVIDGWVESGSMPFAEYHYPFENKKVFEKRRPADFIAEYIGQTRTWFYYLHVIANSLFDDIAFKNVITTGNILAEDGSKMSKSKKNYTDPLTLINEFGADAFRYYLMRSVVMQAEDLRFTDADIKEVKNRLVTILYNVFKFYSLYQNEYNGSVKPYNNKNVLDQWILSRLGELQTEVTENLDAFNTIKAARPIRDFVTDFSTWYLRRSRDRFKGEDERDKQQALATTRFVLIELSKIIAPFMPFIADTIYREVTEGDDKESVHLEEWPTGKKVDTEVLSNMSAVREVVSLALEARERVNIKVRQPLRKLTIKDSALREKNELLELIKDEVNVKEIAFSGDVVELVVLDTELTSELKEEGMVREFIRQVQNLRKDSGFTTHDQGVLTVAGNEDIAAVLKKFDAHIKRTALLKTIVYEKEVPDGEKMSMGDSEVTVALTK